MDDIDIITRWISEYHEGYHKYMVKYHLEIYKLFRNNIQPPQAIGDCVYIGKSAKHTDEDYNEIRRISGDFCRKYKNPEDFPTDF